MSNYKNIVLVFLISNFTLFILFIMIVIISDPLQVFHKNWFHESDRVHSNKLHQVAGMINNFEFDSAIFGSSMLQKMSPSIADKYLQGDFLNLSINGSLTNQRYYILKYLLKKKKMKKVILSMDISPYVIQSNNKLESEYLYDKNYFNDFQIYLNRHYLKCIFTFDQSEACIGSIVKDTVPTENSYKYDDNLINVNHWKNAPKNSQIYKELKSIKNEIRKKPIVDNRINNRFKNAEKYVDKYLFEVILANPDTEFIILFPPYSRVLLSYYAQHLTYYFETYKHILKYMTIKSKSIKNLKIYNFDNFDFINDFTNYSDLAHYNNNIANYLLKNISENKGIVTIDTVDDLIIKIEKDRLEFDLHTFTSDLTLSVPENQD